MTVCPKCGTKNVTEARFCHNCATPLTAATTAPQVTGAQPEATESPSSLPPQLQPGQKASLLDYLSHYKGLQVHWAKRFIGLILDAIFVVAPVLVIFAFMDWWLGWIWFTVVAGVILFLYSALFEDVYGATIGKAIVNLKVVSIQRKLDLPSTLIRNVTKIFVLLLLIEFLATLVVQTTDAHQRYMDKLSRTTVVERMA